jgi:hypothetical protein
MRRENDELWSGSTYLGRWKVISKPGAIIQAKILEMSPEMRRSLTTAATSFPPHQPRRKRFW